MAWLALSVLPVFGAWWLFGEHLRRNAIAESGVIAPASVAARHVGEGRWGRTCATVYQYDWQGRRHISMFQGCPDALPVGASLKVAFDPAEPERAYALAEGQWIGRAWLFPFVLLAAFVALTWYLAIPALRAIGELVRRRR